MIVLAAKGFAARFATRSVLALLSAASLLQSPVATAQLPTTPAPTNQSAENAWQTLFEADLEYLADLIGTHYIYATYAGGPEWEAQFQRSLVQATHEAELIADLESYRAVLQHFVVSFEDAHLSANFLVTSRHASWPRFVVEYQGGRYVVVDSELSTVRVGDTVSACGGRSMHEWIDDLAEFFGGPPGRETTRAAIARQAFVDRGNPLYAVPQSCRIGSHDVELEWVPLPSDDPSFSPAAPAVHDDSVNVSDFNENGSWIRIGTMTAATEQTASEFRELYRRAPTLRNKDFVVIDVRGNGGGVYNWFMAFLRAFYGAEYADYYARARLEVAPVMMTVSQSRTNDPGFSAEQAAIEVPPDPPLDTLFRAEPEIRQLEDGRTLTMYPAPVSILPEGPPHPPEKLVNAKVYLLTDYGCASACIAFVDEVMRFPGVTLIGAETHIDRRSGGWPMGYELPSGLALVRMGRMVREGRGRGENEAWVPAGPNRFRGDISDTQAVRCWIESEILPRDSTARGAGVQRAVLKGPE